MLPHKFAERAALMKFTSKKADVAVVSQLYEQVWRETLSQKEQVRFYHWTDVQVEELLQLLDHLPKLSDVVLLRATLSDPVKDRLSVAMKRRGGSTSFHG